MTKTIITKKQFTELYELARELLEKHTAELPQDASMDRVSQVQWMFNGAIELITRAYTDIKEDD